MFNNYIYLNLLFKIKMAIFLLITIIIYSIEYNINNCIYYIFNILNS